MSPSKVAFKLETAALSTLCSFFIIISALIGLFVFHAYLNPALRIAIIVSALVLLILLLLLIKLTTRAQSNCRRYEITQDQVITYDGISSCKQYVNNLKGMIGMELSETFIGKMFNYGTISLKFLGGSEVKISNIDHPEKFISKITEIVAKGSTSLD